MSVSKCGVRVGAAAFVLGLSLAGPHAVGVAAADSTGADSGSVSAGPGSAGPAAANTSRGSAVTRGAAGRAAKSAAAARPAASTETRRRTAVVPAISAAPVSNTVASPGDASERLPQTPAPSAAQLVGVPTRAPAVAPLLADVRVLPAAVSSAKPAAACGSCWAFGATGGGGEPAWVTPPTLRQVATVHLVRTIDQIGGLLSGLPNTPFTDFVSGVLLMVRRALVPDNPGVGSGAVEPFLKETDRNDGVKGTIKNSTGEVVRVSFNDGEVVRELQPGQEMTYYDGHANRFWMGTYNIFGDPDNMGGRGPSVRFEPPLGTPNFWPPKRLFLFDKDFYGPMTRYTEGEGVRAIFTYRAPWKAGEVNQEVTRYTNIKVTFTGYSWNGGYDNWWNSDWAVFNIEILKNEPYDWIY